MNKNVCLISFGIGDSYCDPQSSRYIRGSENVVNNLKNFLEEEDRTEIGAYIRANNPRDTFENVSLSNLIPETKVIKFDLRDRNFFSKNNLMFAKSSVDDDKIPMLPEDLDFLLRPQEWDIYIVGIDSNGIVQPLIRKLRGLGYRVSIISNCFKPFRRVTDNDYRSCGARFGVWQKMLGVRDV